MANDEAHMNANLRQTMLPELPAPQVQCRGYLNFKHFVEEEAAPRKFRNPIHFQCVLRQALQTTSDVSGGEWTVDIHQDSETRSI
jgi:hypothetical protein